MSHESLCSIQQLYKSDIRSMINFIQTNQHQKFVSDKNIIDNNVWKIFFDKLSNQNKLEELNQFVQYISMNYNIDKKNIIKHFLNYIIRHKMELVTSDFLVFVENIMHFQDCKNSHYVNYSLTRLSSFLQTSTNNSIQS